MSCKVLRRIPWSSPLCLGSLERFAFHVTDGKSKGIHALPIATSAAAGVAGAGAAVAGAAAQGITRVSWRDIAPRTQNDWEI